MKPLVSIVIPCFNAERYVAEAVESALAQTWEAMEVIVVDDGSTDGSARVLASFGERIRLLRTPNRGACAARNLGLKQARGAYVQFLDADDVLFPEKIARQLQVGEAHPVETVFCDCESVTGDGRRLRGSHLKPYEGGDVLPFVLAHQMQTPAPLHPVENLRRIGGFRADLPCAQEFDLNLRLACSGVRFFHLRETLCRFRKLPGSVSSNWVRVLDQYVRILPPVFAQLESEGTLTEPRRRAFAATMAAAARRYLVEGEPEKARNYFAEARRMHPGGGLERYGWSYRAAHRLLGPERTERLVEAKRRVRGRMKRATTPLPAPPDAPNTARRKLSTPRPVFYVAGRCGHHAAASGYDRLCDFAGEVIRRPAYVDRWADSWLRLPAKAAAALSGSRLYNRQSALLEWSASRHLARHTGAIYHVIYGEMHYRFLAGLRGKRGNLLVATFHNPPEQQGELFRGTGHLRRLDHATVVAPNLLELFQDRVGADRVSYVPYGVDTETFAPAPGGRVDRPLRCLYGGYHFRDTERLPQIVRGVLDAVPEAEFHLVSHDRVCRELADHPRVRWEPRLDDAAYRQRLREVDLLVLPLRASTAVGTVLECLASGVPVVTNEGGVAAYLDAACAVTVPVGDASGMIDASVALLRDDARRSRMAEAARARALTFAWPRVAEQMVALYRELAARRE